MSAMSRYVHFLLISLFFFLLETRTSGQNTDQDFFEVCKSTRCSEKGPEIRFPFRLNTQPSSCGLQAFQLSCSNDTKTLLHLPFSGIYHVHQISYIHNTITIFDPDDLKCPLQIVLSLNLSASIFNIPTYFQSFNIVNCTERVSWGGTEATGPISCMSSDTNLVYVVGLFASIDKLPQRCFKSAYTEAKISTDLGLSKGVKRLLKTREVRVGWEEVDGCNSCEKFGRYCGGFNITKNATICSDIVQKGSSHGPIIIGASVGGTIFVASVLFLLYRIRKSNKERETEIKIEKFLADYKNQSPVRYTYSDVKKMTGGFKHKLGQGGYGSVYRGKLPNGVPVAVKMLEMNSIGDGKEFMNEVATISRIHHFNVVRLLGYCSEVKRRALVYEYMPNQSLEKFILSKGTQTLSWEKMDQIANGIAHGIEYLHQGCSQRILHFDIKPHNILLDHKLQPKISDFGLAKLCAKEQSVVSMTAARGTSGYMAPELFSRNFGEVSYKSDVYSFGILLLEMVGCCRKKSIDVGDENQSQICFPEWIYNRMVNGEDLGLEVDEEEDEEIAKKLAIVGLWCIQWNPTNRPSMSVVIQMLEGGSQCNKEMPPKPFVSSDVEMASVARRSK